MLQPSLIGNFDVSYLHWSRSLGSHVEDAFGTLIVESTPYTLTHNKVLKGGFPYMMLAH